MGEREEITDLLSDRVFTAKEPDGQFMFRKKKLLKFSYEGSITAIVITKIDRKNKRIWGEHVELAEQDAVISHYRHNVDVTEETMAQYNGQPYCTDCGVPVGEFANEDGNKKALDRADRTLSDGTEVE